MFSLKTLVDFKNTKFPTFSLCSVFAHAAASLKCTFWLRIFGCISSPPSFQSGYFLSVRSIILYKAKKYTFLALTFLMTSFSPSHCQSVSGGGCDQSGIISHFVVLSIPSSNVDRMCSLFDFTCYFRCAQLGFSFFDQNRT